MNEHQSAGTHPTIVCPACGQTVPDGQFCGACGAHLTSAVGNHVQRYHAYAADPSQHVLHPSVVTTLFPHLPHRHRRPFQLALAVSVVVLVIFGVLRWTGPTIAVASLAVPLIYLLQLYEVEVYEDEPFLIIGTTLVAGIVIGGVWAHYTAPVITRLLVENNTFGVSGLRMLEGGVLIPLGAQILMLAGPLALYLRRRYNEALDGFTFGVAGALGFTLAVTMIDLIPALSQGEVSSAFWPNSVLDTLQRGLLVPIVNSSLTGLLCGALWLRRGPIRRLKYGPALVGIWPILAVVVVARVLLGSETVIYNDSLTSAAAYGLAALLALVWVRMAVHYMLLTEAAEVRIGADITCSHCQHIVPRMAFCPNCGIATCATPKTGTGRANRAVRQGGPTNADSSM
jgi:hypothetical protein